MAEVDGILAEILRLRGAEYACLADRAGGRIIGEAGNDDLVTFPGGIVKLEMMVAETLGSGPDDELEDLMISSRYRYHLIRHINSAGAPPLLLYLRLKRSRANLATARRELASAELNNRLVGIFRGHDASSHEDRTSALPLPSQPSLQSGPRQPGTRQPGPRQPDPSPWPDSPRPVTQRPGLAPATGGTLGFALPPLPRRAPASLRGGWVEREREPEPDEPAKVPTVLRQGWAFDRSTMERLVHGLRRMMP